MDLDLQEMIRSDALLAYGHLTVTGLRYLEEPRSWSEQGLFPSQEDLRSWRTPGPRWLQDLRSSWSATSPGKGWTVCPLIPLFPSSSSFPCSRLSPSFPPPVPPVAYQQPLAQQRGLGAFGQTPPLLYGRTPPPLNLGSAHSAQLVSKVNPP